MRYNSLGFFFILFVLFAGCSKQSTDNGSTIKSSIDSVSSFVTSADGTNLLYQQNIPLSNGNLNNNYNTITVNAGTSFQTIDGFGYTLTGASASLLNQMSSTTKSAVLNKLFGTNTNNSIGISYLRVSLGASDLSTEVFSYDDMPNDRVDTLLDNFSLSQDTLHLVPILKEIIAIRPDIKILASPWSAPTWMKNNHSSVGGSLLARYYQVYANYFAKYIVAMKAKGITIDAITIQNEPAYGGNNPSMLMTAQEQGDFIKNFLGPTFLAQNIRTKIIIWDHNCDNPTYPISILNDSQAAAFIDGTAFHLYSGDIGALSQVKNSFPNKKIYFTEQWTGSNGSFSGDFIWHMKNVILGSLRNWSSVALEWNLASDPFYNMHTPGGCSQCKGALTISNDNYEKNVSYYIVAQVAKFVPPGSVRILSSEIADLDNVAFLTSTGKMVIIILNANNVEKTCTVKSGNNFFTTTIPAQAAKTYVWQNN